MDQYIFYDPIKSPNEVDKEEDEAAEDTQVVYKARRKRTLHYYAIRRAPKSNLEKIREQVMVMNALGQPGHPSIVQFHDWYATRRHIWVVTEYCSGGSLESMLNQDERLPVSAIKALGSDILGAILHAHKQGWLIGACLHPKSILCNEYGVAKVAEFEGACRIPMSSDHDTPVGNFNYRYPEYTAPELWPIDDAQSGEHSQQHAIPSPRSTKSDLWAFGCLLYTMACGRPPFGTGEKSLKKSIQEDNLKLPSSVVQDLDFDASDIERESGMCSKKAPGHSDEGGMYEFLLCYYKYEAPSEMKQQLGNTGNRWSQSPLSLLDMLCGLLQKDPSNRITYDLLCNHPFWWTDAPVKTMETQAAIAHSLAPEPISSPYEPLYEQWEQENVVDTGMGSMKHKKNTDVAPDFGMCQPKSSAQPAVNTGRDVPLADRSEDFKDGRASDDNKTIERGEGSTVCGSFSEFVAHSISSQPNSVDENEENLHEFLTFFKETYKPCLETPKLGYFFLLDRSRMMCTSKDRSVENLKEFSTVVKDAVEAEPLTGRSLDMDAMTISLKLLPGMKGSFAELISGANLDYFVASFTCLKLFSSDTTYKRFSPADELPFDRFDPHTLLDQDQTTSEAHLTQVYDEIRKFSEALSDNSSTSQLFIYSQSRRVLEALAYLATLCDGEHNNGTSGEETQQMATWIANSSFSGLLLSLSSQVSAKLSNQDNGLRRRFDANEFGNSLVTIIVGLTGNYVLALLMKNALYVSKEVIPVPLPSASLYETELEGRSSSLLMSLMKVSSSKLPLYKWLDRYKHAKAAYVELLSVFRTTALCAIGEMLFYGVVASNDSSLELSSEERMVPAWVFSFFKHQLDRVVPSCSPEGFEKVNTWWLPCDTICRGVYNICTYCLAFQLSTDEIAVPKMRLKDVVILNEKLLGVLIGGIRRPTVKTEREPLHIVAANICSVLVSSNLASLPWNQGSRECLSQCWEAMIQTAFAEEKPLQSIATFMCNSEVNNKRLVSERHLYDFIVYNGLVLLAQSCTNEPNPKLIEYLADFTQATEHLWAYRDTNVDMKRNIVLASSLGYCCRVSMEALQVKDLSKRYYHFLSVDDRNRPISLTQLLRFLINTAETSEDVGTDSGPYSKMACTVLFSSLSNILMEEKGSPVGRLDLLRSSDMLACICRWAKQNQHISSTLIVPASLYACVTLMNTLKDTCYRDHHVDTRTDISIIGNFADAIEWSLLTIETLLERLLKVAASLTYDDTLWGRRVIASILESFCTDLLGASYEEVSLLQMAFSRMESFKIHVTLWKRFHAVTKILVDTFAWLNFCTEHFSSSTLNEKFIQFCGYYVRLAAKRLPPELLQGEDALTAHSEFFTVLKRLLVPSSLGLAGAQLSLSSAKDIGDAAKETAVAFSRLPNPDISCRIVGEVVSIVNTLSEQRYFGNDTGGMGKIVLPSFFACLESTFTNVHLHGIRIFKEKDMSEMERAMLILNTLNGLLHVLMDMVFEFSSRSANAVVDIYLPRNTIEGELSSKVQLSECLGAVVPSLFLFTAIGSSTKGDIGEATQNLVDSASNILLMLSKSSATRPCLVNGSLSWSELSRRITASHIHAMLSGNTSLLEPMRAMSGPIGNARANGLEQEWCSPLSILCSVIHALIASRTEWSTSQLFRLLKCIENTVSSTSGFVKELSKYSRFVQNLEQLSNQTSAPETISLIEISTRVLEIVKNTSSANHPTSQRPPVARQSGIEAPMPPEKG